MSKTQKAARSFVVMPHKPSLKMLAAASAAAGISPAAAYAAFAAMVAAAEAECDGDQQRLGLGAVGFSDPVSAGYAFTDQSRLLR